MTTSPSWSEAGSAGAVELDIIAKAASWGTGATAMERRWETGAGTTSSFSPQISIAPAAGRSDASQAQPSTYMGED
jgi:hypothetical protein